MPVINKLTDGLQSVYIDKSDVNQRENALGILKERAVQIEDEGSTWNPFCIFPEGTTSNGSHILKFKRGAFEAMRTVRPCYITVTKRFYSSCYDVLGFWEYVILLMSSLCVYTCTVHILPEFTPNEIMLQKHADKGQEDWEIFAECVRDMMSKQSGLPKSNTMLREKLTYEKMLYGYTKTIQLKGETYTFGKQKSQKEVTLEKNVQEPLIQK